MRFKIADWPPLHATDLQQSRLFTRTPDQFEAELRVSVDEMQRWHRLRLLSFDPCQVTAFDDRHRYEAEFLAAIMRCGLSDTWIRRILRNLPKPYCYNVRDTFFSFAADSWTTVQCRPDHKEAIDAYLGVMSCAKDWNGLRELRDRIGSLLPEPNSANAEPNDRLADQD